LFELFGQHSSAIPAHEFGSGAERASSGLPRSAVGAAHSGCAVPSVLAGANTTRSGVGSCLRSCCVERCRPLCSQLF